MMPTIKIVNLSAHRRHDVATVGLGFARGLIPEGTAIDRTDGYNGIDVEVVSRWPDGSAMHAIADLEVDLQAGEQLKIGLVPSNNLVASRVDRDTDVVDLPVPWPQFRVDGEDSTSDPDPPTEAHLLQIENLRTYRVGPFWARLLVRRARWCRHFRWWLHWGLSDSRTMDYTALATVELVWPDGTYVAVRHEAQTLLRRYGDTLLLHHGRIGDGQAQVVAGIAATLPADASDVPQDIRDAAIADAKAPLIAMQTDGWNGAFGPWGRVPAEPVSAEQWRAWVVAIYRALRAADPWQASVVGYAMGSHAGDDADFGRAKLTVPVVSGDPTGLIPMQRSAYAEACRPQHDVDALSSPIREGELQAGGARAHKWSGRYFTRLYPDSRFYYHGKTFRDNIQPSDLATDRLGKSWFAVDRQHCSKNHALFYALLTGDPGLRWLIDSWCETWLGEHPVDSPSPTMNSSDTGRAIGRGLWLGVFLYELTGRADMRDRLVDRVNSLYAVMETRRTATIQTTGKFGGSTASGALPVDHWRPWEDAEAVVGLWVVHRLTGDPAALYLCRRVCGTLQRFGWVLRGGIWQTGVAVDWNNGEPLSPGQSALETRFQVGSQHDYRTWGISGLRIAVHVCEDPAPASLILEQLIAEAGSTPSRRWAEWAVELQP